MEVTDTNAETKYNRQPIYYTHANNHKEIKHKKIYMVRHCRLYPRTKGRNLSFHFFDNFMDIVLHVFMTNTNSDKINKLTLIQICSLVNSNRPIRLNRNIG